VEVVAGDGDRYSGIDPYERMNVDRAARAALSAEHVAA
jgi:hypothetical protein